MRPALCASTQMTPALSTMNSMALPRSISLSEPWSARFRITTRPVASPKADAYNDGTDLFPYTPPDFADVIDEAPATVRAFHAAYARLDEDQKRNLLLLPFADQRERVQQDAIAAWCAAVGGVYDRMTGELGASTPYSACYAPSALSGRE